MRFTILFLLLSSTFSFGEEKTSSDKFELTSDLYKALEDIAQKHDIDVSDVIDLVDDITLNQNTFDCGLGDRLYMGNDKYITNIHVANQITLGTSYPIPDEQWNGKGLGVSELVVLEKGEIKSTVELTAHRGELQFVLFEPKKIIRRI